MDPEKFTLEVTKDQLGWMLEGVTILGLAKKKLGMQDIGEEELKGVYELAEHLGDLYWERKRNDER